MINFQAPAKINLSLVVTGLNTNGLHSIDMLVTPVNIYDSIYVIPRQDGIVRTAFATSKSYIDTKQIDSKFNSCQKAAELMVEEFGIAGADIAVIKSIPLQAGIGGSSADAAAVIKGLADLNGISINDPRLLNVAEECGSDCTGMLTGGFKRIQSTGEKIVPIQTGYKLYFVLAMGNTGVSTKECYAKHDEIFSVNKSLATESVLQQKLVEKRSNNHNLQAAFERNAPLLYDVFTNDLQDAAIQLNGEIAYTLDVLQSTSPKACAMTGSGAMCYAVFENHDDAMKAYESVKGSLPIVLFAESV